MYEAYRFAKKKDELWYAALHGTSKLDCEIKYCGKHFYRSGQDICDLMLCFYSLFSEMISEYSPDTVT